MANDAATHYLEEARRQLRGHKRMGEGAMSQLRDEEFFVTIDPEANSVAIIVKHLAGNMRSALPIFSPVMARSRTVSAIVNLN